MPRVRIPTTGTIIDWPHAQAGRIRIHASLRAPEQNASSGVRVELSFKRESLRRLFRRSERWYQLRRLQATEETRPLTEDERKILDHYRPALHPSALEQWPPDQLLRRWGEGIAATLADFARASKDAQFTKFHGCPPVTPRSSRRLQRLQGYFLGLDYQLTIDREDLRALDALIATDEGARTLMFQVRWYLLPTILIDWALHGRPRGPDAQARQFLMPVIHAALLAAVELVVKARKDRQLHARIVGVLDTDKVGQVLLKDIGEYDDEALANSAAQRRVAIYLADRTLLPALRRLGMNTLIGRDISRMLDPGNRRPLVQFFKAHPDWLTWWFDLLLGPMGHAARRLKLVP